MEFDVAKLRPSETGRLLTAIVVPRPIAWTITQSPDGTLNAAPFSFFNVLSDDPPLVGLGLGQYGTRVHDTTLNIHQTCEFVVNLVAEKQIEAMNIIGAHRTADRARAPDEHLGVWIHKSIIGVSMFCAIFFWSRRRNRPVKQCLGRVEGGPRIYRELGLHYATGRRSGA